MIVLSLFDGIAGGLESLKRAGISVDKYYASEIDKYSIAIAKYNHPEIIELGDINNWEEWEIEKPDLILAGSPCQGFSMAGTRLNFDDPRSKLFFVFLDILNYYNPQYFLLENVKMKKQWEEIITELVGVEPVFINSELVSAQSRPRLYWTNIPNVTLPEDREILLRDVVFDDALFVGRTVGRRINEEGKRDDYNTDIEIQQRLELRTDNKSGTITTVQKDNTVLTKEGYAIILHNVYGGFNEKDNRVFTEKSPTIRTASGGGHIPSLLLSEKALEYMDRKVADGRTHWDFKHHSDVRNDKSSAVVANFFKGVPYGVLVDWNCVRYLHPIECERLQTLTDNYTEFGDFDGEIKPVSKTRRYNSIGNGWTIEVIVHILKGVKR